MLVDRGMGEGSSRRLLAGRGNSLEAASIAARKLPDWGSSYPAGDQTQNLDLLICKQIGDRRGLVIQLRDGGAQERWGERRVVQLKGRGGGRCGFPQLTSELDEGLWPEG